MAARRWSIINYNAFLRGVKREFGVSHRHAQQTYKLLRDHLGRSVRAVDIERHPRLTERFVKPPAVPPPPPPAVPIELPPAIPIEIPPTPISSVEDWLDEYDELWEDEEESIYEGTTKYERKV